MTLNDRMARAEDYVLGLMDEHERERAERDMEVDAEFRNCVMELAERLRRLRERTNAPISIPDDAWRDISQRIAAMPQMAGSEAATRMVTPVLAPPSPDAKGFLRLKRPYAHQFGGWRGTVVAVALAAAMAAGYLAGQSMAPAPRPEVAAVLSGGDGVAAMVVEAYAGHRVRLLPLAPVEVPAGKVLQFWAGGMPLGALARAVETTLTAPEQADHHAGQRYEVTLEDMPGSSTGRPQGPVVLSGQAIVPPR